MKQKARKIKEAIGYHLCFWIAKNAAGPFRRFCFRAQDPKPPENLRFDILIPVYRVSRFMLRRTVRSVQRQDYRNWRIILAYSGTERPGVIRLIEHYRKNRRMTVLNLPENLGISGNTNAALKHAAGDYVTFLDQDDLLEPQALKTLALTAAANRHPDLIYTDEDKIVGYSGIHITPHYKPDWNPALLLTNNYITHLAVYKRELIRQVGELRSAYDGSQDYDYVLRASELAESIVHLRKILYHWRIHHRSTAKNFSVKSYAVQAGAGLLENALERRHIQGDVAADPEFPGVYQIRYVAVRCPLVSLILYGGAADRLERINQLLRTTAYKHLEISAAESETDPDDGRAMTSTCLKLAEQAKGDYLVFLSLDVEPVAEDWLDQMVGLADQHEYGYLSPLLIADGRAAGPAVAIDGRGAISLFHGLPLTDCGDFARMKTNQVVTALQHGCLLISRRAYDRIGRFAEAPDSASAIIACLIGGRQNLPSVLMPTVMMRVNPDSPLYQYYDHSAMPGLFAFIKENYSRLITDADPYYPQVFMSDGSYRMNWRDVYRNLT